jgi:hypothetical protein
MEFNVKKQNNKLVPYDQNDLEEIYKLKESEVYRITIKKDRNYKFHKKFNALIRIGYNNTDYKYMKYEVYRDIIICRAGFCTIVNLNGEDYVKADKISFDKMSQDTFQELYNKCITQIAIDIEADEHTIEKELVGFL